MFRDDAEFRDDAAPSHLGLAAASPPRAGRRPDVAHPAWAAEAEKELDKIPFFVRGKARRNTERFARSRASRLITVETLYDAKAHFGR